MGFYSDQELSEFGFKNLGTNVRISNKVSIYGAENMIFGDNIRIDDFCILTGNISVGSFIHIAAYSFISGWAAPIILDDFVNISSRVNIFSASDDYSGETLTSPLIPDKYKKLTIGSVHIKKHCIVGANSVLMPDITLAEGSAIGSMSFVNKSTTPWMIYCGIPIKILKKRKKDLIKLEKEFMEIL